MMESLTLIFELEYCEDVQKLPQSCRTRIINSSKYFITKSDEMRRGIQGVSDILRDRLRPVHMLLTNGNGMAGPFFLGCYAPDLGCRNYDGGG